MACLRRYYGSQKSWLVIPGMVSKHERRSMKHDGRAIATIQPLWSDVRDHTPFHWIHRLLESRAHNAWYGQWADGQMAIWGTSSCSLRESVAIAYMDSSFSRPVMNRTIEGLTALLLLGFFSVQVLEEALQVWGLTYVHAAITRLHGVLTRPFQSSPVAE